VSSSHFASSFGEYVGGRYTGALSGLQGIFGSRICRTTIAAVTLLFVGREARRHRPRFTVAYAVFAVAACAALAAALWQALPRGTSTPVDARCADTIPSGQSFAAAWSTTEHFVADVILNASPGCGYDLSTRHLRHGQPRADWATTRSPVKRFATRYPPTPILRARRDPKAPQAVYVLSRRVGAIIALDKAGRRTIPMMVGLSAPDAGLGAYNLVLVVEDGNWRVDAVKRVRLKISEKPFFPEDSG
jgi:hypothetical protein